MDREDPEFRIADERQGQRRRHRSGGPGKLDLGNAFWWVVALIGPVVGAAWVLTLALPSSALWMSRIVCSGSHNMEHRGPHFECVSDAGSHTVNILAVVGAPSLAHRARAVRRRGSQRRGSAAAAEAHVTVPLRTVVGPLHPAGAVVMGNRRRP
ncbi:MAG TPA: hypothetical protein VFC01_12910, partial [Mycobacterium sp.]|nr:hypothetical protein [Mycobacterium sp.]